MTESRGVHNGKHLMCLVPLVFAACGPPLGADVETTGEAREELIGTPTTRLGVVELKGLNGHFCSGVMISPHVVLTAGHCAAYVLPAGTKSAVVTGPTVRYQFPDGVKRCISAYPTSDWECSTITPLRVTQWPGYTNDLDTPNDFAVFTTDIHWYGPGDSDFAYIYTDTMTAYSRYQLYGYGGNAFGGAGGEVLRTGSMEWDSLRTHDFTLIERGTRVCLGDSGGPATVYQSSSGAEMHVAGLFSNMNVTPSGFCGAEGATARYTRLSVKVPWIKSTTGAPCTEITSPVTGHKVQRCF